MQRFPRKRIPVKAPLDTKQGFECVATEFCASLATEGLKLADLLRAGLSNQLVDLLTFTLLASECDMPAAEGSVKKAHLLNIQRWIEAHILDAELSLEKVASANGMLLSNLHVLFAGCEMLVSEWIWDRRLQLAYDSLARGGGRSFSSMAFDHGFSSSAHFSTIFERKYGCRLEMLPVAYCSPV